MLLSLQRDSAGHYHSVSRVEHVTAMAKLYDRGPVLSGVWSAAEQLQRTKLTSNNSWENSFSSTVVYNATSLSTCPECGDAGIPAMLNLGHLLPSLTLKNHLILSSRHRTPTFHEPAHLFTLDTLLVLH